jgi:hypothetical protein
MVEHRTVEVDRGRVLHQVGVDGVAASVHIAVDKNYVTDFERSYGFFGEWRL